MKRALAVGFLVILGLAMFEVVSACAFDRGATKWLALVAGLIAFPVVPGAWHALRELRRRRNPPAKAVLTAIDRVTLRVVTVALVVGLAAFGLARDRTWQAIRHHGAWWLPTPQLGDRALLELVPPSAEGLVWLRGSTLGDVAPTLAGGDDASLDAISAGDAHDGFMATRGKIGTAMLFACSLIGCHTIGSGTPSAPPGSKDLVVVSKDWQTALHGGPSPALAQLLARVPDDAVAVAVGRPARLYPDRPVTGAITWITSTVDHAAFFYGAVSPQDAQTAIAWIRRDGDVVEAHVELAATDEAAAERIQAGLTGMVDRWAQDEPCNDRVRDAALSGEITRDGLTVRGDVRIPLDAAQRFSTGCVFGVPVK